MVRFLMLNRHQEGKAYTMADFDFVKVRDEVIANIGELVTETAKNELVGWFRDKMYPYALSVADAYEATLKKQAETEHGWCKMRDGIVLPTLFSVVEFTVEKVFSILGEKAKAEEAAAAAAKKAEEEKAAEAPAAPAEEKPAETVTTIA